MCCATNSASHAIILVSFLIGRRGALCDDFRFACIILISFLMRRKGVLCDEFPLCDQVSKSVLALNPVRTEVTMRRQSTEALLNTKSEHVYIYIHNAAGWNLHAAWIEERRSNESFDVTDYEDEISDEEESVPRG